MNFVIRHLKRTNLYYLCFFSESFYKSLYFFKATDLVDDEQELDPDENIETKVLDIKQAWQMIKDGEIRDGKTIAGISLVMF